MKALLTFVLTLTFFSLSAQKSTLAPRHSFKYGFGTTYLDSGDFFGKMQYLDYQYTLARPLNFTLGGARTKAFQDQDDGFKKSTLAFQLDGGLMLNVVRNKVNSLKLGGGGSWRYAESQLSVDDTLSQEGSIFNRVQNSPENRHFGFFTSLEYEVYIATHISLGSRFTYAQYKNGDRVYFWGLNAGFRF